MAEFRIEKAPGYQLWEPCGVWDIHTDAPGGPSLVATVYTSESDARRFARAAATETALRALVAKEPVLDPDDIRVAECVYCDHYGAFGPSGEHGDDCAWKRGRAALEGLEEVTRGPA